MAGWSIRPGRLADLRELADIERAADTLFPAGRLPPGDDTYPVAVLQAACAAGLLFIAEVEERIAGFAVCEIVDCLLHLAGLAVHPDFGRRGMGAALVRKVVDECRARRLDGVTLTTFGDLAWNAPFYQRFGFRIVAEAALSPHLAATLQRERAAGMQGRVAMNFVMTPSRRNEDSAGTNA